MDRKDGRYAAVSSGDLLQRQCVADMVGAGATPLRRHQRAHEAELAEFGQRLFRELRLAIARGCAWRKQVLRDIARRIAQQGLFFGQPHSITLSARARIEGGTATLIKLTLPNHAVSLNN